MVKNDFKRFESIVMILCILIIVSSLIILAGWILEIPVLKTPDPNYSSIALTTAVCFILVGISIILLQKPDKGMKNKIGKILALIVLLVGIITLVDYIINYTTDASFIAGLIGWQDLAEYKMSVVAAISFVLTGLALILLDKEPVRGFDISQTLMGIVGVLFYLVVLGFIYQTKTFHVPNTTPPSIYGTIVFILIILAIIFSRPDKGIIEILISDRLSGAFGRALFPAILFLPLIFGLISLLGERSGLYDSRFTFALMAFLTVVVLLLILIRSMSSIDHIDILRLKAEQSVKESAAEIEDLYNNAPCGYHSLDKDGKFARVNDTELSWLGYTREELIGKDLRDVITEDSQRVFEDNYEGFMGRGYVNELELEMVRKDGSVFHIIVSATAVKDAEGNFLNSRSTLFDITELKNAQKERNKLIIDLKRSNEDLKSFAYIASHDLQEPLRTMSSYAGLLKRRYEGQLDEDADDFIEYIVGGASQMQNLIKGLLEYSRLDAQSRGFKEFNSEDALNTALSNLKYSIEESNAEISYDPLPMVYGDYNQIVRVFQNLIGNALKFRREDVQLEIHVSMQKKDDECIFSVNDNGIGFEEEYNNRIFEVFKKLHGVGEYSGAGIGLAIVKRIINRHRGDIWVESKLGEGSTFYFTLPLKKKIS